MSDRSLGYILAQTKQDPALVASKLSLARDCPYAQNLKLLKTGGDFSKRDIHYKYDWYSPMDSIAYSTQDDMLNIAVIKLKVKKKKKQKSKKETTKKKAKTIKLKQVHELITDQSPIEKTKSNKGKKKKKKQKVKSKKKSLKAVKSVRVAKNKKIEVDSFTSWINTIDKGENTARHLTKAGHIKKKKKKKKKKKNLFLQEKIIHSNTINDAIASERLAELFSQQGHYDKAIEMYERLILKNPEKSSFFAPLIEELKQKQ